MFSSLRFRNRVCSFQIHGGTGSTSNERLETAGGAELQITGYAIGVACYRQLPINLLQLACWETVSYMSR